MGIAQNSMTATVKGWKAYERRIVTERLSLRKKEKGKRQKAAVGGQKSEVRRQQTTYPLFFAFCLFTFSFSTVGLYTSRTALYVCW